MEKKYNYLFLPLLIFFGSVFFVAALNSFSTDDFEFLNKYNELGFAESVSWFYHHWNTRWMAIAWLNCSFVISDFTGGLFWYHLTSFTLLWMAFYRLSSELNLSSIQNRILISGYATMTFFYSVFSVSEVFFWINSSAFYLFGCIAFLFLLSEVTRKQHTVLGYSILVFAGMYLGGAYEPLAFTTMISIVGFLFFQFYYSGQTAVKKSEVLKSIILLSVLMISFAISYAGEGHAIRSTYLPHTTFTFKSWVLVKSVVKMFGIYLPFKLITAFFLIFPIIIFFRLKPIQHLSFNSMYYVSVLFAVLIVISLFPLAFIMSEMGPERAWSQISVFVTLYAAFLGVWIAFHFGEKWNQKISPKLFVAVLCCVILGINVVALRKDYTYSKAVSDRMTFLSQQNKLENTVPISLEPLPPSGFLHSAEISENPNHYSNQQLKEHLKLNFQIKKK